MKHNRVAIFGLTGDPFTIAHRDICKQAMDTLDIDRLYVIPTVVDYHRKSKSRWLNDIERVECMMRLLQSIGPDYVGRYFVDTNELSLKTLCKGKASLYDEVIKRRRFIHTLLDFKVHHCDTLPEIFLIIGADELQKFPSWHLWDCVLDNITYLAVVNGRDGKEVSVPALVKAKMEGRMKNLDLSKSYLYNVSATAIRHWYRNDSLAEYLEDVRKLDSGEMDWLACPWIRKESA